MKNLPSLLTCTIVAVWAIAIAIFSVQNATLVSLRFFGMESIQIPIGIALSLSTGVGILTGAIAQLLQGGSDEFQRSVRAKPEGSSTRSTSKNYEIASEEENW